jgi:hypothetical protein
MLLALVLLLLWQLLTLSQGPTALPSADTVVLRLLSHRTLVITTAHLVALTATCQPLHPPPTPHHPLSPTPRQACAAPSHQARCPQARSS